MKRVALFAGIFLLFSADLKAAELTFGQVWAIIAKDSRALKASTFERDAASEARHRASRHWLPRLYLDAKGYQTNDPALSFFGVLSQRSVKTADFAPSALNEPGNNWFSRGSIGFDLPLYEGGMKASQAEIQEQVLAAKNALLEKTKVEQFLEVSRAYGAINALAEQREKFLDLQATINKISKAYQIGSKSNPVGYSGLLGIKTLANRIQGFIAENQARYLANKAMLEEMGLHREDWVPVRSTTLKFIDNNFREATGVSAAVSAQDAMAHAARSHSKVEAAKYLPRIGAFAEKYLINGNRKTEGGYSAGFYLQWNLFNPNDYGLAKEARLNALAVEQSALAFAEQERADAKGLREAIRASRENLELMEKSEALLEEQTRVAENLFRNGSINALQLVEALSRRADLVSDHAETQMALLKLSAEQAKKTKFQIPVEYEGAEQ